MYELETMCSNLDKADIKIQYTKGIINTVWFKRIRLYVNKMNFI